MQGVVLAQGVADGDRRLEYRCVQLAGSLFQWTQRVLQSLTGGLQLELPQPLLHFGFSAVLLLLGAELRPHALLLDPELLLDQALACGDLRGLQPALGLDRLQTAALLSRPTLLAQELAAQVKHADAVAPRIPGQFVQRILAHRSVGHVDVDVRAGVERREALALDRHKVESRDALGNQGLGGHADLHQVFHRLPWKM